MFSNTEFSDFSTRDRGLTVVLADDAIDTRLNVQNWLEELGCDVFCFSTGAEAMRLIRQRSVDLVITEVILPNGDGLEVIGAVRKAQPKARIVAYSAGGRYLSALDCLRVAKGLGAHQVLPKPTSREELLNAVSLAMPGAKCKQRVLSGTNDAPVQPTA